ncbi:MAG: CRTAC1 family protein [Daejeonella sp.]|uniref:CRTAC1 family protein n=1 Tax=Daejeonella sp. TaxID=2805397 RepID=UPI0027377169|nr:CRTAC1 family protein [Daejeonella sp.]MDP3469054.1 CRTAC1 family protein [Daejeonella sp.]
MFRLFSFLFFSMMLISCKDKKPVLFSLMDHSDTGIDFRNNLQPSTEIDIMKYTYFYNGGGVAIGDINNDGLQDVFFTGNMVKNRLYLNKGNFEFENITQSSNVTMKQGWSTGVTMVDINNDGFLDIYICQSADYSPERRENLLYINNGDLTFTEQAEQYGLADQGYSTQASFFDYDKDGDLDMFLINHSLQQYTTGAQENPEVRKIKNPDFASKLYRNDNGRFTDVSEEAGITSNVLTFGLGLAISDVNNDNWPDIYVSNDFNEPDYLFINNKNGTFTDQMKESLDQISLYSMGSDIADYNNDGLTDIYTLDMLPEDNKIQKMHAGPENFDKVQFLYKKGFHYQMSRNMLHKNNGDGTFSEIGQLAGVSNTDWSWSGLFSDFDNDGLKDLLVTNGYVKDYNDMDFIKYTMNNALKMANLGRDAMVADFIEKMPTIIIPNYIYRNKGKDSFEKKTNDWGLNHPAISTGAAYADLDNDGDMDLIINNINSYAQVYKNNREQLPDNNYLKIKLNGTSGNSAANGSKITLFCKNDQYFQEQMPVRGFQSSVDPVLNFGLGKHTKIDSIRIVWPDDKVSTSINVKANQLLNLSMTGSDSKLEYKAPINPEPIFTAPVSLGFIHKENYFRDFTQQSLLLNFLSREGPCMAKGDVNRDGRDDLFIGGASGQAGGILLSTKTGEYRLLNIEAFKKDAMHEDTAAEFLDIDGDGDLDLYVASGGYEFGSDSPLLQDRIYINDGKGNFSRKTTGLPQMLISTGTIRSSDIDGDGDLDLFIGGRVVPGMYPSTPESKILKNDGKGNFSDGTDNIAPEIKYAGMVTDAVWIDVNQDNVNDLIVVGEWMPIRVFLNQKGKLVDKSSDFIKFGSSGWWNSIYADDMDGDGDKDIIIGNLGLNAQFRASEKEPLSLYYKDFDSNGSIDPIFCYYIDGVSYPAASRDDLTEQLPFLKNKFLFYKTYSTAKISDLFNPEELKGVSLLSADFLKTVYLENRGKEGLKLIELPIEAQFSPVYGIRSMDVNNDNKKDIVLGGNNIWTRVKFGQYTANHGMVFLGDGKGRFKYMPQKESGLKIRGNVRSMEILSTGNSKSLVFGLNDSETKLVKLR